MFSTMRQIQLTLCVILGAHVAPSTSKAVGASPISLALLAVFFGAHVAPSKAANLSQWLKANAAVV